jgi:hypothetical protein
MLASPHAGATGAMVIGDDEEELKSAPMCVLLRMLGATFTIGSAKPDPRVGHDDESK